MSFEEDAKRWLGQIAEKDREYYEPVWDVEKCGHVFLLQQKMSLNNRRPILGVDTKWGKQCTGSEYCYFDLCEELTLESFQQYTALISEIEKVDVEKQSYQHSYTFISVVLLTNNLESKELKKRIKRHKHITQYQKKDNEYGWSACRFCVMDLKDRNIYYSVMGEMLRSRLQGKVNR